MSIFKRRKNKKQNKEKLDDIFFDPELDIEAEFRKRDIIQHSQRSEKEFSDIEDMQYVRLQCEQAAESSRYIAELKLEYQAVSSYLNDISLIESCQASDRILISKAAQEILELTGKREKYIQHKPQLSSKKFARFQRYEELFPKALTSLQNDEKYAQAVRHDMRILEAEKISLKEDIENLGLRRGNLKNISIISLVGIVGVFIVFFASQQLKKQSGMTLFMVVLLLAAVYVLLIFFLQRRTIYNIELSQRKLARAVTLLNKTKIKYVNIANSVDYQLAKYDVKNSYELSREYELYLTDKKADERFRSSSAELNEAVIRLNKQLDRLGLYDSSVWEAQAEALAEPKEMIEVRHKLNIRRQKLRDRIDYNMERIEDCKKNIMNMVRLNSSKAKEVMAIVDSYDVDF